MKASEINKLNQNLETLNSNIEKLISLMSQKPTHSGVVVTGPLMAEASNVVSISSSMAASLVSRGFKMSNDEEGVSVVELVDAELAENCDSSCFERVRYNPRTRELTVYFRGNRSRKGYSYGDVSPRFYNEFMMANSLGRFYTKKIKGSFTLLSK